MLTGTIICARRKATRLVRFICELTCKRIVCSFVLWITVKGVQNSSTLVGVFCMCHSLRFSLVNTDCGAAKDMTLKFESTQLNDEVNTELK